MPSIMVTEKHLDTALDAIHRGEAVSYCRKCILAQAFAEAFPGEMVTVAYCLRIGPLENSTLYQLDEQGRSLRDGFDSAMSCGMGLRQLRLMLPVEVKYESL